MKSSTVVAIIVFGIPVSLIIFILCRTLTLWYFRLNEIADTLKAIHEELKKPR